MYPYPTITNLLLSSTSSLYISQVVAIPAATTTIDEPNNEAAVFSASVAPAKSIPLLSITSSVDGMLISDSSTTTPSSSIISAATTGGSVVAGGIAATGGLVVVVSSSVVATGGSVKVVSSSSAGTGAGTQSPSHVGEYVGVEVSPFVGESIIIKEESK